MEDNQVEKANTHGFFAVRHTGSLIVSVQIWRIRAQSLVVRDQFTVLLMSGEEVIEMLDGMAAKDGTQEHLIGTLETRATRVRVKVAASRERRVGRVGR